ncbi:hypothetical protein [Demequina gelatinilytica]|nr:hypothetical protein [Demequina gelatinilytica]
MNDLSAAALVLMGAWPFGATARLEPARETLESAGSEPAWWAW